MMTTQITEAQKSAATMRQNARVATGSNSGQFTGSASDVEASRIRLQQSQAKMSRLLAGTSA